MSVLKQLVEKKLAKPPAWLPDNVMYETIMGSVAYGVSSDTSDMDVYGFAIPPKHIVFPHLAGEIMGFGKPVDRFAQYQQHHMLDQDAMSGKGRVYDVQIYNIVKYFQLCMENNPNMVDSLFTPTNCVLSSTRVGNMVRERRRIFLHKGSWHTFKGYAYSQLHKMANKALNEVIAEIRDFESQHGIPRATKFAEVEEAVSKSLSLGELKGRELRDYHLLYTRLLEQSKRYEGVKIYGYDPKFAYHIVRLINEVEQILVEGDLDLQRNNEQLKDIRRGCWNENQIREWFTAREKELAAVYDNSKLPHSPVEAPIKQLLLDCLEEHYGSLEKCVVNPDAATNALREIKAILDRTSNI